METEEQSSQLAQSETALGWEWRRTFLVVLALELLAWILLRVIGSGVLGGLGVTSDGVLALSRFWSALHFPVNRVLLDYFGLFSKAHPGLAEIVAQESAYVLMCAVWIAVVVCVLRALWRSLHRTLKRLR